MTLKFGLDEGRAMSDSSASRQPPASAPPTPISSIERATVYVNSRYRPVRIEGKNVTWVVKPADKTARWWEIILTYSPPRARTRTAGYRAPYPGELVILSEWGHPDQPPKDTNCISFFPGQPVIPPRDPVFDAWLAEYLSRSGAVLLADFRNPNG